MLNLPLHFIQTIILFCSNYISNYLTLTHFNMGSHFLFGMGSHFVLKMVSHLVLGMSSRFVLIKGSHFVFGMEIHCVRT